MKTSNFFEGKFEEKYKGLNPAQRQAVDAIDGPVMVIAGPGTGKTQVLALRIGNILKQTDSSPDAILCLTFTNSGVSAMKKRLEEYIGQTARNVRISTFHAFAIDIVLKNYALLDFENEPQLLTDENAVMIVDDLFENGDWQYLNFRSDPARMFGDLKRLMSLLKKERITHEQFLIEVENEIKNIENDESNISSQGPTKGQLKVDAKKKIESFNKTKEVISFYEKYEQVKFERSLMDYDDCLQYAVRLAEESEDVRADILENFQYVLVDEHQDSSGIQNDFLKAVWSETPSPNIFVVGDDRQLIYGFSGANLDYFTGFSSLFGKAQKITLTENYRSTEPILNIADELLQSTVTKERLNSNTKGNDFISLKQYRYSRDEIIGAGIYFKKLIENGTKPSDCALLLPQNYQVKNAGQILRSMGLPVVSESNISLLDLPETESLMRILQIIANPFDGKLLAEAMLDKSSQIPIMQAHTFIKNFKYLEKLTIENMIENGKDDGFFSNENEIFVFGNKLKKWIEDLSYERISHIVSVVGNELLIDQVKNHQELLSSIEIVRSFIHSATIWEDKNKKGKLSDFILYFIRLSNYKNQVEVARLSANEGINIMTLHKSKGLEFEHVVIGHMNQETFLPKKKNEAFALPEIIKEKIAERDEFVAKRELYVAITRAKIFCTISFAEIDENGKELSLLNMISDLSDSHFVKSTAEENEEIIMSENPRLYAQKSVKETEDDILVEIKQFVKDRFSETNISVSMLNNFFECPRKWYFRNFLKLPEVKNKPLILGNAVHGTLEFILKSEKLPETLAIKSRIKYELEKENVIETKDVARFGKEAFEIIENWIKNYYPNLAKEKFSERNIRFKDKDFPNLTMYGKIDLTEIKNGEIVITDFKTGKSHTKESIQKTDEENRLSDLMRQLAMYSYLVKGAEDKTVAESRLMFLEAEVDDKKAIYSTQITQEQIDLLKKDIADYQDLFTTGDWTDRTCNVKTYGAGKVCEYCARMKNILDK